MQFDPFSEEYYENPYEIYRWPADDQEETQDGNRQNAGSGEGERIAGDQVEEVREGGHCQAGVRKCVNSTRSRARALVRICETRDSVRLSTSAISCSLSSSK